MKLFEVVHNVNTLAMRACKSVIDVPADEMAEIVRRTLNDAGLHLYFEPYTRDNGVDDNSIWLKNSQNIHWCIGTIYHTEKIYTLPYHIAYGGGNHICLERPHHVTGWQLFVENHFYHTIKKPFVSGQSLSDKLNQFILDCLSLEYKCSRIFISIKAEQIDLIKAMINGVKFNFDSLLDLTANCILDFFTNFFNTLEVDYYSIKCKPFDMHASAAHWFSFSPEFKSDRPKFFHFEGTHFRSKDELRTDFEVIRSHIFDYMQAVFF